VQVGLLPVTADRHVQARERPFPEPGSRNSEETDETR
jgi:hypothetical protein